MFGFSDSNSGLSMSDKMVQSLVMNDESMPNPFQSVGLKDEVYQQAVMVYRRAVEDGTAQSSVMTIIDFSKHSREKRLWTIDLYSNMVLYQLHVSHGRGSDSNHDGWLDSVSNTPNSKQSSAGLYQTAETYRGKHGYSLRLDGLEKDVNDNARERAIVVHGADYATDAFIQKHGKTGRSFGCPAVSDDVSQELIDTIKDGTLLWIYVPDSNKN
jgi:hypothetical protein